MARSKPSRRSEIITIKPEPPCLTFKPKHPQQLEALQCCRANAITFLSGPAGTAKTFCATWYAMSTALEHSTMRVFISRPAVTSGAEIGFLPGSAEDKMNPFLQPIVDAYTKLAGTSLDRVKSLVKTLPLCYIRGRTIENAILIVDEAQNLTPDEIVTIVTRVGEGGKIILCGDVMQNDLYRGYSVLEQAAATFDGACVHGRSVGWYRFTSEAIVRDPLTSELIDRASRAEWYLERNQRR